MTDGIKDEIWTTAGSSDVTFYRSGDNYPLSAKFYYLHDGSTLFLALEYNDTTSSGSDVDIITFRFGMNNTYTSSDHLDVLSLGYWTYFYGLDRYYYSFIGTEENDADLPGGTLDIQSGGSYTDGKYFWEVSHPLDSSDSYDFTLTEDSSIEFIMGVYNDTMSTNEIYSSNIVHILAISSSILPENIQFLLPIVLFSVLVYIRRKEKQIK